MEVIVVGMVDRKVSLNDVAPGQVPGRFQGRSSSIWVVDSTNLKNEKEA